VSAVIVSLRVPCDAARQAFDVFTQEIGAWWQPNGLFQLTPRGDGALQFRDPAKAGGWSRTLPNGKTFEIGRIDGVGSPVSGWHSLGDRQRSHRSR
jgi:hypothetical protein